MKIFFGILYLLSLVYAVSCWYYSNVNNLDITLLYVFYSVLPALITTVIVLYYKFRTNLGLSGRPGKLLIAGSISWFIGVVALYNIDVGFFNGDFDLLLKYALIPIIVAFIITPLMIWALKKPSGSEKN